MVFYRFSSDMGKRPTTVGIGYRADPPGFDPASTRIRSLSLEKYEYEKKPPLDPANRYSVRTRS